MYPVNTTTSRITATRIANQFLFQWAAIFSFVLPRDPNASSSSLEMGRARLFPASRVPDARVEEQAATCRAGGDPGPHLPGILLPHLTAPPSGTRTAAPSSSRFPRSPRQVHPPGVPPPS